ncbi:MAG: DEAD/DEAH box helicase, partial [Planctomycetes bacterium]|nr:DEAD/DEAH box helicase [Planctomycetota bacterium]
MNEDPLQTAVQFVPGVGPARAELLARLGIRTVEDVLWYLPRDVLDLSKLRQPRELEPDRVQTVRGVVVDRDIRELTGGRSLTAVLIDCEGQFVRGTWFNQPWMFKKFRQGDVVLFSGKPKRHAGRWEFNNPHVQWIGQDESEPMQVLPRYGLTEGLRMHDLRRITRGAVERFGQFVVDCLPAEFRRQFRLPHLREAIRAVHCPTSLEEYRRGRHRIVFDDLLEFQLGLAMRRRAWKRDKVAPVLTTTAKIDARIRRLFPFEFTPGQNQAVEEITRDLASGQAMHRLLQAEVGAGKTAVALYAMLVAVAAGYQATLMAPTEVLASQHWQTLERLLAYSRVNRLLLTGSLTPARRREALEAIRTGEVQLVVGTHAVIQQDVVFHKLGLAVIDEQHKFGVAQRAHFSRENQSPHVLVMTATPIPRSLCLTQFGDLDITRITDLPP